MKTVDKVKLIRSISRDSFYQFVKEFWHTIVPEEPVWNWHIEYLCNEFQAIAERVFRMEPKEHDLIVNISPGTTKSTIASEMFCPWTWTRMPTARHLVATHTERLGHNLSRYTRDIVQSEMYRKCFPDVELRDDQNAKGFFMNTKGGLRLACTVGGASPIGFHGHFITTDDPIDPQQAKAVSAVELKAANDYMTETLQSRKVNKKVSVMILIMQRLHQNDPTGHRLANKTAGPVRHICLPADRFEFPVVKPPELKKMYVKGLMDPERLPRSVLEQDKAIMGQFGYAGQHGQSPVPPGGGMFKIKRLKQMRMPEESNIKKICRFWDKAGVAGEGDWTVGGQLLMTKDNPPKFLVTDVIRGQWDSNDREDKIAEIANKDGKKVIIGLEQEPGSGGKHSAEYTVGRLAGFRVRIDKPTGDKVWRADPFSVQVNNGNVYLLKGAEWIQTLIEEMEFFPVSTYDDQVDALSGAFNILTGPKTVIGGLGA